jgi:hypothetical protein
MAQRKGVRTTLALFNRTLDFMLFQQVSAGEKQQARMGVPTDSVRLVREAGA